MAMNKSGQYVYQKGDGLGGFLLDLVTKDAANVKQRQQTIRRVTDGLTNVATEVVTQAGSIARQPGEITQAAIGAASTLGSQALTSAPAIISAAAPILPGIARAAAPFVGGIGGEILAGIGARVGMGGSAYQPPPPAAPAPAESGNGVMVAGAGLVLLLGFIYGRSGEDKK